MKKILCVIPVVLVLMFSSGCSKKELNYTVTENGGIKTFHNKNIPSDPAFKISPKEIFTIHGFDENAADTLRNFIHPHDIAVDTQGYIYILDSRLSSIKKFDKNGKFITSIGKLGQGPGEMQMAAQMLILEDTLYVSDLNTSQNLTFTTDGNFIRNLNLEANVFLSRMIPVTKNIFISEMNYWENKNNEPFFVYDLHLRDYKFNILKSLSKKDIKYIGEETKFHELTTPFGVGRNQIYIARYSTDVFSIDVHDSTGILLYRIQKDYRKIEMPVEDTKEFAESRKNALLDDANRKFEIKYKKAINVMSMFIDKNGYLLVQVPLVRNKENEFDFVVDAFKDGVFINRFKMNIGKAFDFYNSDHKRWFIGDRIYYQNREDNCVTVFEY